MKLSEIIRTARGGTLDDLASEEISEIVKAVRETGKAGALTITLKFSKNGDRGVQIDAKHNPKVPAHDLGSILMYANEDGELSRHDPEQGEMFSGPRGVVEPRRMIRDEEAAAGGA